MRKYINIPIVQIRHASLLDLEEITQDSEPVPVTQVTLSSHHLPCMLTKKKKIMH